jgi:hypothetical protein
MNKKKSYSISYGLLGYQPLKEPENTPLNPHSGGSGVQHPMVIDGEPLSTKQLHELITSQSMTIDRLLGEVNRYKQAFVELGECLQKGYYLKAGWIIREMLK